MNDVTPGRSVVTAAVIVAARGYFVDIYDLILFSVVRMSSLKSLGLSDVQLIDQGLLVINSQMAGMLLGGVLWGALGDKRGRLQTLFASITLYSLATIANGFVQTVPQYAVLRFIAGIGLAGELGAGVTLVAEVLPTKVRGWGTMLVASVGVSGAVLANIVSRNFDWRTAYFIGGALGLGLLLLRIGVSESEIFRSTEQRMGVKRGNFLALFATWERTRRYVKTVLIGTPTWYLVGILITLAPEFAKAMGVTGAVTSGDAVMYAYLGLVVGDVASGTISQLVRSRKKVVIAFILLIMVSVATFFTVPRDQSATVMYASIFFIGVAAGYWALFVTIGAEQFGTNLRATAATTVPNFARGALVPISAAFQLAKAQWGLIPGAAVVGAVTLLVALVAAIGLDETFGRDLDYVEP